ncbi:MAG TPA: 4-hydroxythreonine-4-phosphate dehydrogenase PdxA [Gammaproteobacteria bacterium]|nr:4-hydroxythreonine-4-phosphate dehydrogenase PdxA [Gammaproteobacteria bacterium]
MKTRPACIALTTGEPAGIGPDICIRLAQRALDVPLVVLGDAEVLAARAHALGVALQFKSYAGGTTTPAPAGTMNLLHIPVAHPVIAGRADPSNAAAVLVMLDRATDGCLAGEFAALVTAPVNKAVIADAGIAFSGHTEYLAARCGAPCPVMLLVADRLRVALATTHLPLRDVPQALTRDALAHTLRVLHADLRTRFDIPTPRIRVLGLNPHAGEAGHLGREEIEIITPVCDELRAEGMQLTGPVAADTAFNPAALAQTDAVLAMYHDQGLPVLKYAGFGHAVNVTLGLPMIRTSVDHGTALELAGTGRADPGSLEAALALAVALSRKS